MEKASSSGWSSDLAGGADTIVARSSPAGRGGLAVIRVSGGGTRRLAAAVCPGVDMNRGWRATLVDLIGPDGATIDRGVALPYPAPRSFTGEDMLEVMVHGSPWVVRASIEAFAAAGARPAEPGEFTRRAVANGKLDLVQAEAINDLATAETAWQARLARAQAAGLLSREFAALKGSLSELLAVLEAALDFADHEVPYDADGAATRAGACLEAIRSLEATAAAGRRVREGVRVVIVGPPNSGKSTLFNRLVGRERAIVSPHAGTTRDVVEVALEIAGVPVVLIDTAGLAVTEDPVEREGIRRAEAAVADADGVIVLWPADDERAPDLPTIPGRPALQLRSKADLVTDHEDSGAWMPVSCVTGEGVDELRSALAGMVSEGVVDLGGETAIGERHRQALVRAAGELEAADFALPELAAEAVRGALDAVRELLGEVVTEDLLDRIFASFCIGK